VNLFVVGSGYVGLTTAVGFARLGHFVAAHDIDADRVASLSAGKPTIFEPGLEAALAETLASGRLRFTLDPAPPDDTDFAVVCVPTPIGADGLLGLSLAEEVVRQLLERLPQDGTIVVRSTMPLDAPERLLELAGSDGGPSVVVNPEFMREGNALADFAAPSRVVVGYLRPSDRESAERFADLYRPLGAPILVGDARSVVLIKLASNVFLSLKVAFANELARLCDAIGADVAIASDGIGLDTRIGRSFLDPGPGIGGSCLPEQDEAIAAETALRNLPSPLLSSIAVSNEIHRSEIVATVASFLPDGLPGARIALLGLAFKANTDDVRRSPALALAGTLRAGGATVVGYDPVAGANARRVDPELVTADSASDATNGADVILVATEWREFDSLDWTAIARGMRGHVVYDTRRCLDAEAVAAAGLRYVALGRAAATMAKDPARP
jgi:UDPglucose 6-dehydrogenase